MLLSDRCCKEESECAMTRLKRIVLLLLASAVVVGVVQAAPSLLKIP